MPRCQLPRCERLSSGSRLFRHRFSTALLTSLVLGLASPAPAQFQATFLYDAPDVVPGNGRCDIGGVTYPPPLPSGTTATCTLRAAIQETNALGGGTISLEAGIYELSVPGRNEDAARTGDLDVTSDLAITGPAGAPWVTTIDANGIDRVFHLHPGLTVSLSGVTIRGGVADALDGSGTNKGSVGAGVYNEGSDLSLSLCILRDNLANAGAGLYNADSSTPPSVGNAIVDTCTFANNRADDLGFTNADGGAIVNGGGTLEISGSTLAGNFAASGTVAGGGGAAIRSSNAEATVVENSTITGNHGSPALGSLNTDVFLNNVTIHGNQASGIGFGSCCGHLVRSANTIVAHNQSVDCDLGTVSFADSLGYNTSSDTTCGFTEVGDLPNVNPGLAPLALDGEVTPTLAPLYGSPAIDSGDPAGCRDAAGIPLSTDQVGEARPLDGDRVAGAVCDMGAVEVASPEAGQVVLLDSFQDDTVGQPPNGAEVGSVFYAPNVLLVEDDGRSDWRLASSDADDSRRILTSYVVSESSRRAVLEYLFRVESGATLVGDSPFYQQVRFLPGSHDLLVHWGEDGSVVAEVSQPAGFQVLFDTDFTWELGVDYHVVIGVDPEADVFDLTINGLALLREAPYAGGFDELFGLRFWKGSSTLATQVIDDVTITKVPEPPRSLVAAAGLAGLAAIARRRRRPTASAVQ